MENGKKFFKLNVYAHTCTIDVGRHPLAQLHTIEHHFKRAGNAANILSTLLMFVQILGTTNAIPRCAYDDGLPENG